MKWEQLLKIARGQPVIETNALFKKSKDLPALRVQLSRWVGAGRLIKVRNGIYILAESYRTGPVQYEYTATLAYRPSYISLEYALADHGLIPETIPNLTLITTRRPHKIKIEQRLMIYRHIKTSLFWGYETRGPIERPVYFAEAEKALLDYFYFTATEIDEVFLEEMRLQNLETLDLKKLIDYAHRFKSPKILRAAEDVVRYSEKQKEFKTI